jgi:hypothetical protein
MQALTSRLNSSAWAAGGWERKAAAARATARTRGEEELPSLMRLALFSSGKKKGIWKW